MDALRREARADLGRTNDEQLKEGCSTLRCGARSLRHEDIRRLLRGTLDGHDGQVLLPGMECHVELHLARLASHQGPRT